MAKYLVTNSSYFKPFSYEELLKPIMHAEEVHNATQDAYDTLNLETEALRQYISKEGADDQQARKLYDNYTNKLKTLQENLWKNGVTAQTRRDLAAARAGYASDITRLQKAIQTRQERSQEYWKMRHANPDLIMGSDPGSFGLDNYLNNDNYGQNYFTLDGNKFMQSVGIEAKARAGQMLSDPQIKKIPGLEGYLNMIVSQGFSTKQVDDASTAVQEYMKGSDTEYNQLDPGAKILADVLMTNINNSGAVGNVSPEELVRLFDYGRRGLSTAIAEPKQQTVSDLGWKYAMDAAAEEQRQRNRLAYVEALKNAKNGKDDDDKKPDRVTKLPDGTINITGDAEKNANLHKFMVKPFENPITYTDLSGRIGSITNIYEADAVRRQMGLGSIETLFGLKDATELFSNRVVVRGGVVNGRTPDGTEITIKKRPSYGASAFVGDERAEQGNLPEYFVMKNGVYDEKLSDQLESVLRLYHNNRSRFEKNNPGVDIDKLAGTDSEWKKFYKENGIPEEISRSDAESYMKTIADVGKWTVPPILDTHPKWQNARSVLQDNLLVTFHGQPTGKKDKVDRTGNYAIYKVNGSNIAEKGVESLGEVFGTDNNGKILRNTILSIDADPALITKGLVTFTTANGKFATKPFMFGTNTANIVEKLQFALAGDPSTNNIGIYLPLMDPARALTASAEDVEIWRTMTGNLLAEMFPLINPKTKQLLTPADIVRDSQIREGYKNAIIMLMIQACAPIREALEQDPTKDIDKGASMNSYLDSVGYSDPISSMIDNLLNETD